MASQYLLDACYSTQYIDGNDVKTNPWYDTTPAHIRAFAAQCRKPGIKDITDISTFNPTDPEHFIIIDFATDPSEPPW